MSSEVDVDAIDAELCRINPEWTPRTEEEKDAVRAFVRNAPPMGHAQARRVAQIFGRTDAAA